MEETYFQSFLNLLDDNVILKESTAIGVMFQFRKYIKKIKSEVLLEIQSKGDNRNDYLDYLINEIEQQDYLKNIDVSYVQKWLDEYQITIEEIFNINRQENAIENVIDSHYNDMEAFSTEKDKAFLAQSDFLHFFCKYYADELIDYLNSLKKQEMKSDNSRTPIMNKLFKDEYLKIFCKNINNERVIEETCFSLIYDSITHYVPYFENEILENLVLLSTDKKDDYLNFAIDTIKKTEFSDCDEKVIEKWLNKYNSTVDEFPNFKNEDLTHWLKRYYNGYADDPNDYDFILDIQIDFYWYAAGLEAQKMISFLESKKSTASKNIENQTETTEKIKWIGKPSQLGFIIGKLAELGYIDAPTKPNGDINFTQFAKLVNNTFNVDTTEATLSKYLNLDSEKGSETIRKFNDNGFDIPHLKTVS